RNELELGCHLCVGLQVGCESMSHSPQGGLGSVVSLWLYPVKAMMGEELNASEVTEYGLVGDRGYALVDSSNGKVASAKNPRTWPRLFDFRRFCRHAAGRGAGAAGADYAT